jgi:plastocyanin domain-containing protein
MVKNRIHKTAFLFLSTIVIVILFLVLHNIQVDKQTSVSSTFLENGMQIIEITAKNGYTPNVINADINAPTIIRIKTSDTYDCSAALSIPAIKYHKFLPPNGITDVQLAPQKEPTRIEGSCSMGMYGFVINFV